MWLGAPVWLGVPLWLGALPCSMDLLWQANFLEVAGDLNLEFPKEVRTTATPRISREWACAAIKLFYDGAFLPPTADA